MSDKRMIDRVSEPPSTVTWSVERDLWTHAAPCGVVLLAPESGPPGLGIVFENALSATAIFEHWGTALSPQDLDEHIRVTLLGAEVPGQPPGDTLTIEVARASIVETLAPWNPGRGEAPGRDRGLARTASGEPLDLATWRRLYETAKCYTLVPVLDDGEGFAPDYALQLVMQTLLVQDALRATARAAGSAQRAPRPAELPVDAPPPRSAATAQPPAARLDQVPLADLIDALARAVAHQEGFEGNDLRRHASDLAGQLRTLVRMHQIKAQEERQRRRSTAEIEQLLDGLARSGTPVGAAIAVHRADIIDAFRQVDIGQIGSGVQVLMQWLRDPTADNRAPVEQLLADLHATLGTTPGSAAEREAEASRRRIDRAVRASLEIFAPPAAPQPPDDPPSAGRTSASPPPEGTRRRDKPAT